MRSIVLLPLVARCLETIDVCICQGRLPRSRGFVTLTTLQSDPTAGVHDQQLPERCRHLPEGKLAFDPCPEVNSHALHPNNPDITPEDTQQPLERRPKILGVIMDTSLSFHNHCNYVSDRIDKINNMLQALAGSSWGQEKETLLLTYNAIGKSSLEHQHK